MEKKGKHAVFNLFFRRNYHVYLPLSAAVAAGVHLHMSHVQRVDLIGYHEYGSVKYPQTGMVYDMDAQPMAQPELDALRDAFATRGLTVQLGG